MALLLLGINVALILASMLLIWRVLHAGEDKQYKKILWCIEIFLLFLLAYFIAKNLSTVFVAQLFQVVSIFALAIASRMIFSVVRRAA